MKSWKRFFWFALSGVAGFVVDAGVLYATKGVLGLLLARAASFMSAVLVTWLINRSVTFQDRSAGLGLVREFLAYLGLMLVGGLVNYAVYAWLVLSVDILNEYPVLGVAAGSIVGMLLNLVSSYCLLFRHKSFRKGG